MRDQVLVGLLVAAGFGHTVYSMGPKSLRRWLRNTLASAVGRLPAVWGLRRMAESMRAAAGAPGGSCGGCGSCTSTDGTSQSAAPGAMPEIVVPVSKIGMRR